MNLTEVFLSNLVLSSVIVLALSAIASLPIKKKLGAFLSFSACIYSSLALIAASLMVLLLRSPLSLNIVLSLHSFILLDEINLTVIPLRIDCLSAFFMLVLSIVVLAASLYGFKYIEHYSEHGKNLGWYGFNYSVFVLSMILALAVHDILWFLIFWELMTISSYFLVSYEIERVEARVAGAKYFAFSEYGLIMMAASTLSALAVAGGSTLFTGVRECLARLEQISSLGYNIVTLFFTMGLLVKAAAAPFHTWLPDAHPEAPSNVSAILSGALIKIPVYMLLRFFFYFTAPTLAWGLALAALGVLTILVGSTYMLVQVDAKRLLAYSSVDNMGYILLGTGSAIAFLSLGGGFSKLLAAAAFVGALYHVLNHAIFKSLLFLSAGSILYSTGSRDLDALGGLAKSMPLTSLFALVGVLSLAGIPPFNGFVSKWLIYLATLSSASIFTVLGVFALLGSCITGAGLIKWYSHIFLGAPRSEVCRRAREVPASMLAPKAMLVALCIVLGVLPFLAVEIIEPVARSLIVPVDISALYVTYAFIGLGDVGVYAPALVAVVVALASLPVIYLVASRSSGGEVWACGAKLRPTSASRAFFSTFTSVFRETYVFGKLFKEASFRVVLPGDVILEAEKKAEVTWPTVAAKAAEKLEEISKKAEESVLSLVDVMTRFAALIEDKVVGGVIRIITGLISRASKWLHAKHSGRLESYQEIIVIGAAIIALILALLLAITSMKPS